MKRCWVLTWFKKGWWYAMFKTREEGRDYLRDVKEDRENSRFKLKCVRYE